MKIKRILLRSDFNVPILNGIIQDTTRIDLSTAFIQNLLNRKAKLFIISHLGRPINDKDNKFSLKPVFEYLKEKINNKIYFHSGKITKKIQEEISFLKNSEMIFLKILDLMREKLKMIMILQNVYH